MAPSKHNPASALAYQRDIIDQYSFKAKISERGYVTSVGDGIVWINGLPSVAMDGTLYLEDGSQAMVFHLAEDTIGAILLTQTEELSAGMVVSNSKSALKVPVGNELIGRIIDPLGNPLDGFDAPRCTHEHPIDNLSSPIIHRDFVNRSLLTGNKIMDNFIPIGKGQRELLIGDNGLGKSSLALDIVINQKDKDVHCVYVLIGQNRSIVMEIVSLLKDSDVMDQTTIVVAEATSLPGLKYIAPFAACTMAEFWMHSGMDTLIVYDDLTEHAKSYRELSLLIRRPPGREAYPADIFYLHARLLERSTQLSAEMGGGSMTALPIIETKEGDIASYIPTNLISITDGQIFFDSKLFSAGFLPAIDVSKSVSRVGGKAQHPAIKKEAGRMKLDYLQFLELEIFTTFGARIEASMQKKINRGNILREILKQDRLSPLPIEFQMAWLVAFNEGVWDDVSLDDMPTILKTLAEKVKRSSLTLSSERDLWLQLIGAPKTENHDENNPA